MGLRPLTVFGVGREIGMTSAPTKAIKVVTRALLLFIPSSYALSVTTLCLIMALILSLVIATIVCQSAILGRASYTITFGGMTSFNDVIDIADLFIACAHKCNQGAHVCNIKGTPISVQDFMVSNSVMLRCAYHTLAHTTR